VHRARRCAIVEAPSVLGLRPTGVERLAARLLEEGLAERLGARRAGRVGTQPYDAARDAATQTLNAQSIAEFTPRLADAVEAVLDAEEFPLVLGGDCSILLGPMLALRRRGRYGLLFIDGHADFYQPAANPNGEAASMELGFAVGRGPELLTRFESYQPLVRDTDVAVFAFRDAAEQAEYGSQSLPAAMLALDLDFVRRSGAEAAAQAAVAHVARAELDGFFIHLDADALSDDVMPAVDYRLPDGLSWSELEIILRTALASGRAVGMELTIYNPELDSDGSGARGLVRTIAAAFGSYAR
jgi:arginase